MLEKTPLKSKKFIAFFFSMLLIAGILVTALVTQTIVWPIATFMSIGIMAIAFIAIGYVLSQSALDKFVRGIGSLGGLKSNATDSEDTLE